MKMTATMIATNNGNSNECERGLNELASNDHALNESTTSDSTRNSTSDSPMRPFKTAGGGFAALEVSYELIAALRDVLPAIKKSDADLGDQIQRAASSVALNIAEGQASMKGNRLRHYSIAHGSANEVKAGLYVAKAWGWIDESERTRNTLAVLDRLLGLLWGLTRK